MGITISMNRFDDLFVYNEPIEEPFEENSIISDYPYEPVNLITEGWNPFKDIESNCPHACEENPKEELNDIKITTIGISDDLVQIQQNETRRPIWNVSKKGLLRKDNILTKNQIHFISYIVLFINLVLGKLGIKEKFKKIDHNLKRKANYDYFQKILGKKIHEIIEMKPSRKFKVKDENYNKNLLMKVKNERILKKLFEETYKNFFVFYYSSQRKISLSRYQNDDDKTEEFLEIPNKGVITFQDKLDRLNKGPNYTSEYKKTIMDYFGLN